MTAFKNHQLSKGSRGAIAQIAAYCVSLAILLLLSFTVCARPSTNNLPAAPVISSAGIVPGTVGTPFSYTIVASNVSSGGYSATNLPSWLTINTSTGVITGTPPSPGVVSFTVKASNPGGIASLVVNIIVMSPPSAAAWILAGNPGTNPPTNFIGTTDDKDVVFKRFNLQSGLLNNSGANTSWGVSALNPASTGGGNTAVGKASLGSNTLGAGNVAVGTQALLNNLNGQSNTAVGESSLGTNSSGNLNTGVGANALVNSTGNNNTGIGYNAGPIYSPTNAVNSSISLGPNATALSNQFALSDSIHTIKAKGLPTGTGYVLTDVNGDGNLSLRPSGGNAWNVTGNSGTNPSSNFMGTLDDNDVVFKRFGITAGLLQYHQSPLISKSNTSWGVYALQNNTTGDGNTAIGVNTLQYNNSSYNTAIGDETLWNNTTGSYNTASGGVALQVNTTGSYNTANGYGALADNKSGNDNTGVGYYSLQNNAQGTNNTAIGWLTLVSNATGNYNTAIGNEAMFNNIGDNNIGIGNNAGPLSNSIAETNSISLGTNANALSYQFALSDSIKTIKAKGLPTGTGYILTDVNGNGNLSLQPNTGAGGSSAWNLIGNAGTDTSINFMGTRDDKDVIFKRNGVRSGTLNSANHMTAWGVGAGAPYNLSNSSDNTSIGYYAGNSETTTNTNDNTAVGSGALQNNTGGNNTALGASSLNANVTGASNTGIGTASLNANIVGNNNTGVGNFSLFRNVSGNQNAAFGDFALGNTTSSYNLAAGSSSLASNTSGTGNTGVGFGSLSNNKSGNYNTGTGYNTEIADTALSYGIALGYNALIEKSNQFAISDSIHTIKAKGLPTGTGYVLTDVAGDGNLSLQPNSAAGNAWNLIGNSGTDTSINFIGTTDNKDVIFKRNGVKSGLLDDQYGNTTWGVGSMHNTSSENNTAIGYNALNANQAGGDNTGIGAYALQHNNSIWNTAIGFSSLQNNISGGANTAVGYGSLSANSVGQANTALGFAALGLNQSSNNVGIGYNSLSANTSGLGNTGVGYYSLVNNRTGQYNTAIGYQAALADTGLSYAIALGYAATAKANQFAISDSIHTIKAKGLPTGTGYVLTDVAGDGNLSLQPSAGLTAAQLALLNAGIANSWSINGNPINSTASNFLGTTTNSSLRFRTNNVENMMIDSIGRVCIGITNVTDNSYKLYVEKGIRTRKVKVDLDAWADYVFDANYKLPSLTDVENYIQQNKHLPDVPSAIDVEKNGVDLGENQKVLLQKIEELTLYVIDQNKKIETLQNQNDQLEQLKKEVDDLKMLLQKKEDK